MSYNHLAGRLIETQRSMLGQPAIEIAQAVDGLTVTDDGNVTAIDGDGREIIDELVGRYTSMLGGPAEDRLRTAAEEFQDELALPESLGGPAELDEPPAPDDEVEQEHEAPEAVETEDEAKEDSAKAEETEAEEPEVDEAEADETGEDEANETNEDETEEDGADETEDDEVEEEISDVPGTTIEVKSLDESETAGETADEEASEPATDQAVEAAVGNESGQAATAQAVDAESDGEADADTGTGVSISEPVTVEYTAQDNAGEDRDDADLASVYLMTEDEHSWQAPIAVEDAIVDAVTSAADLSRDDLESVDDYVETERVLSVLGSDGAVSVSFDVEGLTVTLHPSGTVRVH